MSAEENKATARRFVEEFFNHRNTAIMDELFAPDAVEHDPAFPEPIRGREAVKAQYASFLEAFPDLHLAIEAEVAEGDTVVQRFTCTGTNTGPLPGGAGPATGKPATWTGVHIARVENGIAVEGWGFADQLGMLMQLGVIPMPGQAPTNP